jgi:endonuclease/exonuclease/phosphatase family metal-dependent hydrolase
MASTALHRIVTFNVRRFTHQGNSSVEAVVERLRPFMPISILALNEVDSQQQPNGLSRLSSALGLEHVEFFGHARGGVYGNAILASTALTECERHLLDGGTVVLDKAQREHRIVRGLLSASTVLDGVPVGVAVTHLDHMSEGERSIQAHHLLRALSKGGDDDTGQQPPVAHQLLLGDMNALARGDYTAEEWAAHEAHNASQGWGTPVDASADGNSLSLLLEAGFTDCVRQQLGGEGGDSTPRWRLPPWSAHVHASGPRYRIDYVLSRATGATGTTAAAEGGSRLECVAASVENTLDSGCIASDHAPVVVDFTVIHA